MTTMTTTFADTQPAPLSALSGSALDDFRVAAPAEVQALLRQVADSGATVHLTAEATGGSYTTTLWTVDAARGRVSFSADEGSPQLQALLDGGSAMAVCYLDAIKLQFRCHGLLLVRGTNACALQGTLPAELFRFQRRNSFRVRTLPRTSPTAHVPQPAGAPLELRVLDVSIEGCALLLPRNAAPLPVGGRIERVQVELDTDTRFETVLEIHHATSLTGEAGGVRLGCSMHRLSGDAQRALQRYIDGAQKKRRLFALE